MRDTLVSHGLLAIQPRRRKRSVAAASPDPDEHSTSENAAHLAMDDDGAGRIADASAGAAPTTSAALAPELNVEPPGIPSHEEAHSSTNKLTASGQH